MTVEISWPLLPTEFRLFCSLNFNTHKEQTNKSYILNALSGQLVTALVVHFAEETPASWDLTLYLKVTIILGDKI